GCRAARGRPDCRRRVGAILAGSLRRLQDFREAPVLRLRERPGLDDADEVADVRLVLLVVGVELDRAPDDFLIARVRLHGVALDDDRLVHRVGNDDAAALLAPSTLVLGLLEPDDRLANRRPLARRLRALPPLASRDVLARTLPLGLLGRSGRRL